MPQGLNNPVSASQMPSLEELAETVAWLNNLFPLVKVKLTGGEPLLRKGLTNLVQELIALPGLKDLSMTTNGSRLAKAAEALCDAGLRRVNVSLDSLHPLRFRELTGGCLQDTLEGIDAAVAAGLNPIKLNAVLRRSCWREDVPQLLDYAARKGFELRFIELMETGVAADWARNEYISNSEVRSWLETQSLVESLPRLGNEPARRTAVHWQGERIVVGWISPQSQRFCAGCDRLRLDARGRLRRCLMDPLYFPLTDCLKKLSPASATQLVRLYIERKLPPSGMITPEAMAAVGG
jgi:cyclic pyranopterin phosphate synthase